MQSPLNLLCLILVFAAACGTSEAGAPDGSPVDGSPVDADPADAVAGDASPADAMSHDSSLGDAEAPDASASDAEVDSGASDSMVDASAPDAAGGCNLAGIGRIPRSSAPVMAGTYCDALYACAESRADVMRIEASSSRFRCVAGAEPASGCSAFTCVYSDPDGRAPLDSADFPFICPVTVLEPMPMMRCVVFI